MDIETARRRLAAAEDKEPNCTCPSPEDFHEEGCPWLYWMYEIPKATAALAASAPATLAALILAVEALSCDRVVMSPCRKVRPEVETWCAACKALAAWEKL